MSIFNKIFGDPNEKFVKSLQPLVDKINSLSPEFEKLSDEQLKQKTSELKEKLARNNAAALGGLDDILPEAFALVREASKRSLNQRHFDSQLIGGIVTRRGKNFICHSARIFKCIRGQGRAHNYC